ncbi:MAG: glucokinase [Kangiellaceae bacterium]|nr:glucokinase [Kangiellaceae bacterium]
MHDTGIIAAYSLLLRDKDTTMPPNYPYVVADIGGTNSRFGLVTEYNKKGYHITNQQKYPSNQFSGIKQATQHYIASLNGQAFYGACLAVAGPVAGNDVCLTNLNWNFSTTQVQDELGLSSLEIINDFAAYAYAAPLVADEYLVTLNEGNAIKTCPIAVVGPGTGFGVASLVPTDDSFAVVPAEGGHITISAKSQLQFDVISALSKEFSHVCIETVLSGPGLRNLYRALNQVEGLSMPGLRAAQITEQAISDADSLAFRTLQLFSLWLGQVTGDFALSLGARGGVFLGGGILLRIVDFLAASEFIQGFTDKGKLHGYVSDIPVKLIIEGNSALLGAAAWHNRHQAD